MVKVYALSDASVVHNHHHHHHWCYIARTCLGTSTGEGLMGETNERSQQLSLLLQGGELVVEVDRGFEDMELCALQKQNSDVHSLSLDDLRVKST